MTDTHAVGKAAAAWAAAFVSRGRLIGLAEKLELFSRTLQSKGVDTALPDQIASVRRVLPASGAVVFDVGANVGNWSKALLAQAGEAVAQLHCFEPAAVNIARIRALNEPRITVHPFAVGAESGEREFYSDFAGSGIASLYKRDTSDAPDTALVERVTIRRLDDVVRDLGLDRVDLMKMDIEGAELDALHGLSESFARGAINSFTFEIGTVNITSRTYLSDFFTFATRHGFAVYRLTAGGGLHRIENYRVSQECFATTNYLATSVPLPG